MYEMRQKHNSRVITHPIQRSVIRSQPTVPHHQCKLVYELVLTVRMLADQQNYASLSFVQITSLSWTINFKTDSKVLYSGGSDVFIVLVCLQV